jgi:GH35 family endo-1,4-beta-xylanase
MNNILSLAATLVLGTHISAVTASWHPFEPFGNPGKKPAAKITPAQDGHWTISEVNPTISETLAGLRTFNSTPLPPGHYVFEGSFRTTSTPFADGLGYGRFMVGPRDRLQPWVLDFRVAAGPAWQDFRIPFRITKESAAEAIVAQIVCGNPGQVSEWRGLRILPLDGSADTPLPPPSGITYPGREPDAAWRREARKRIANFRMSDLEVMVKDESGQPLSSIEVEVRLVQHAFPFGSALDAKTLLGKSADSERYRTEFLRLFNAAVLENDLKWPALAGEWSDRPREQTLRALRWLKERKFPVRAHALVWGGRQHLPRALQPLLADPAALEKKILSHIRDATAFTRGLVTEWDVVNEPREHNQVYGLLGPDIAAEWFRAARQSDPEAKLYVNEFDLLVTRWAPHPNHRQFLDYVAALRAAGAPIDGIGEQAHIWDVPVPPAHLLRVLDLLGSNGLPIVLTEFDFAPGDETLQADYTRDFLLAAFSHPSVEGIYLWGFWDGKHWRENAGLFRKDWSQRPSLKAYEDLVHGDWTTTMTLITQADGSVRFRGFPGHYSLIFPSRPGLLCDALLTAEEPRSVITTSHR